MQRVRRITYRVHSLLLAVNGWHTISVLLSLAAVAVLELGGASFAAVWMFVVLALVVSAMTLMIPRHAGQLGRLGNGLAARTVLVLGLALASRAEFVMFLTYLVAAGCMAVELTFRALDSYVKPIAVRLPGANFVPRHRVSAAGIYWFNMIVLGVLILTVVVAAPIRVGVSMAIVAVLIVLTCVLLVTRSRRAVRYRRAQVRLTSALAACAPEFAFYWDAPAHTVFQAAMWLPYLERVGREFIVIMRNRADFDEVAALTSAPVVYRQSLAELDDVIVPSLKVVCYVNSASRNTHMLRYTGVRHIQLNHGDSDKAPSVNPNFRAYDRDFVAGQAAIDRFAHAGVHVQDDLFRIVGRPQVEDIEIAQQPIGTIAAGAAAGQSTPLTVLYAPTWAGANDDSQYCSLRVARPMIEALLERGFRVMFRPHGYTFKDHALQQRVDEIDDLLKAARHRAGVWHGTSEEVMARSFVDCVNESDAMIADVSSVVSDYLFSEKPFAMIAVSAPRTEFVEDFPVAAVGYVLASDMSDINEQFDVMFGDDSLRSARRAAKARYLGEFALTSSGDAYVEHFTQALRDEIDATQALRDVNRATQVLHDANDA